MKKVDRSREINWSEIAREATRIKVNYLQMLRCITVRSKSAEEDAPQLGRQINVSPISDTRIRGH